MAAGAGLALLKNFINGSERNSFLNSKVQKNREHLVATSRHKESVIFAPAALLESGSQF